MILPIRLSKPTVGNSRYAVPPRVEGYDLPDNAFNGPNRYLSIPATLSLFRRPNRAVVTLYP